MFIATVLLLISCAYGLIYENEISIGGYDREHPPKIILSPGTPGPLELRDGEDLYSRCSVESDADLYTFRWIRRTPDGREHELSQNAVLFLVGVRQADLQNPIYCQVTRHTDGERFEQMLDIRTQGRLTEMLIPNLQLTVRSLPAENLAQGQVMRQCTFPGDPKVNEQFDFRWLDQSGRVVNHGDVLIVLLKNLAELGNYTCEATHRQTGTVYQARYRVTRAQEVRYTVDARGVPKEVVIGRPYEIICEVNPQPDTPVQFRWYFNEQLVGQSAILRLPQVTYHDIGTYRCQAEWTPSTSRSGGITADAKVELNLALTADSKIEMEPPPGSVLVALAGTTRELHCEYSTRDQPTPRWFFEKQPLEYHPTVNKSGNVHRMDRLRVSIVTLRNIEVEQTGTYECQVNGEIKQTHVIVRVEEGLDLSPDVERVDENSAVEFHCQVHGANRPVNRELQWYFRPFYGGPMTPLDVSKPGGFQRHDSSIAFHTSFISKMHARKSDEGEYICRFPEQNIERVARLYVRTPKTYRVSITPALIRVRINQPIELECYVMEEGGGRANILPKFRVRDTRIRFDTDPIAENKMIFRIPQGLTAEFNGTQVECLTDQPGNTAISTIIVESTCPQGYRRCQSGECLPAGRFCDGVPDCSDRSDENPLYCAECDPIAKTCEVHRNQSPVKKTYMLHWECDGEDDCGNGFDEANCPDPTVARCGDFMFNCPSGNRRIPMAYVCDKDSDCPGGEDERHCTAPTIQDAGETRHPIRRGSQLVLTCRVSGHPPPRVLWRFNWGCLPDEVGRFHVTSSVQNCDSPVTTVISTLTVSNVRPGDDGIYNCEGLAGGNRAMSSDYIVMIED